MKKLLPFLLFCFLFTKSYATKWGYDTTFGNHSRIDIDSVMIISVQFQSDGKIIALGGHYTFNMTGALESFGKTYLYRFTKDGKPDTSFRGKGSFALPYGTGSSFTLQPDDKIIVGGGDTLDYTHLTTIRFSPDGYVDTSYTSIPYPLSFKAFFNEMKIQPDGKLLIAGKKSGRQPFTVARFRTNGTLDSAFGINGMDTTYLPYYEGTLTQLLIQPDKKILLIGSHSYIYQTDDPPAADLALIRLNTNGSLDTTFGKTGKMIYGLFEGWIQYKSFLLTNGKLLVLATNGMNSFFRFTESGGKDGKQPLAFNVPPANGNSFKINCGAVSPNGGMYYASSYEGKTDTLNDYFIGKVDSTGSLDSNFNEQGYFLLSAFKNRNWIRNGNLQIQADGKIVLSCISQNRPIRSVIIRLMEKGVATNSFQYNSHSSSVNIYPNPAKEESTVEFQLKEPGACRIELYDLEGRVVKPILPLTVLKKDTVHQKFSLKDLPKGMYILAIQTNNERKMLKLIKE